MELALQERDVVGSVLIAWERGSRLALQLSKLTMNPSLS